MKNETEIEAGKALLPSLKWAGGKRWLVPHLLRYWQSHAGARLVEPFCGGLSVALGLLPDRALLNDINPHLMNFYYQVRMGLVITIPMVNDETAYYACRAQLNALIARGEFQTAEAASLFYYLNKTGYNGLCRFNASGGYNVPFGRYKAINYRTDFTAYQGLFCRWNFNNASFERVQLWKGDFVYADPPYDVPFTQYSAGGFDWDDQVKTAEWLARHDGPVVLSNQATPRIEELYRDLGYDVQFLKAPRRISCTGDRAPAPEVLASRNVVVRHESATASDAVDPHLHSEGKLATRDA